jgi:hypothetical protein
MWWPCMWWPCMWWPCMWWPCMCAHEHSRPALRSRQPCPASACQRLHAACFSETRTRVTVRHVAVPWLHAQLQEAAQQLREPAQQGRAAACQHVHLHPAVVRRHDEAVKWLPGCAKRLTRRVPAPLWQLCVLAVCWQPSAVLSRLLATVYASSLCMPEHCVCRPGHCACLIADHWHL